MAKKISDLTEEEREHIRALKRKSYHKRRAEWTPEERAYQKERDRKKLRRYHERHPEAIKESERKRKAKRRKYATDEERLRAHRDASKRRAAERVAQQQKEWLAARHAT